MQGEAWIRRSRKRRYRRLAALFAGPMGPALLGHPELAGAQAELTQRCPGTPGLLCEATGGVARTCWVRRLEALALSAAKGGKRRRIQEATLIRKEILPCLEFLKSRWPYEWRPVLEYVQHQLEADLQYLETPASGKSA
ncbi:MULTISPECIES: hypothetical protein [unclassified Meiothermus]|uniref:hypothetical protein n=1 Tax=unclassified Meiothermus TaxID=370471 RepID=UPI000D7CCF96|nr:MULTISPECIES: hypothetical protein [unclassified Meiothermus]PZA06663.1 hypothetical protein DNA98_11750 [Meiothermus sp. Pnk-1]RYM29182.1 hypothetical protein EWH23_16265 [Meiothermus sp. PNK-Is4]